MKKYHEYEGVNTIESSITCPYCQHQWDDSWEVCPDEDRSVELNCDSCGKKLSVRKCVTIDYRSYQNCALNGEVHEWRKAWWDKKGESEECKKCGMNRYPESAPAKGDR